MKPLILQLWTVEVKSKSINIFGISEKQGARSPFMTVGRLKTGTNGHVYREGRRRWYIDQHFKPNRTCSASQPPEGSVVSGSFFSPSLSEDVIMSLGTWASRSASIIPRGSSWATWCPRIYINRFEWKWNKTSDRWWGVVGGGHECRDISVERDLKGNREKRKK